MTLIERVYHYLKQWGKPITALDITSQEEFQDVQADEVEQALYDIVRQDAAVSCVCSDETYFYTDMNWRKDPLCTMQDRDSTFPQPAADYAAYFNNVVFDTTPWNTENFSICFPEGARIQQNPDDDYLIRAEYVIDDGGCIEKYTMWIRSTSFTGDPPSRTSNFAEVILSAFRDCGKGTSDEPEIFRSEQVDAAFILNRPTTFIYVATPWGQLQLRIDWELNRLPPEELVLKMVRDWLRSYRNISESRYYLPRMLTQVPFHELQSEVKRGLNDLNQIVSTASEIGNQINANLPLVRKMLICRNMLEYAAQTVSEYGKQYMPINLRYPRSYPYPEDGLILYRICSHIRTEIQIPTAECGTGAEIKNHTIQVYPAFAEQLLHLSTIGRVDRQEPDLETGRMLLLFYDEQMPIVSKAEKSGIFRSNFLTKANAISYFFDRITKLYDAEVIQTYHFAVAQWRRENAQALQQQDAELAIELSKVRAAREQELTEPFEQRLACAKEKLNYCNAQKTEAETALSRLGFFRFAEKKELRDRIQSLADNADSTAKYIFELQGTHKMQLDKLESEMRHLESRLKRRLEYKYPTSAKPLKPEAAVKEVIWEYLRTCDSPMTVTQIFQNCYSVIAELSSTNMTSKLLQQLVEQGRVERIVKEHVVRFIAI